MFCSHLPRQHTSSRGLKLCVIGFYCMMMITLTHLPNLGVVDVILLKEICSWSWLMTLITSWWLLIYSIFFLLEKKLFQYPVILHDIWYLYRVVVSQTSLGSLLKSWHISLLSWAELFLQPPPAYDRLARILLGSFSWFGSNWRDDLKVQVRKNISHTSRN